MKPKSTGSKRTASGGAIGKSKGDWHNSNLKYPYFAICVQNDRSQASLERGKAYRVIKPLPTDPVDRIRVIDEESEDYLYPAAWFVPIQVSSADRKSVLKAVSV
jgi:hypothetical protein